MNSIYLVLVTADRHRRRANGLLSVAHDIQYRKALRQALAFDDGEASAPTEGELLIP